MGSISENELELDLGIDLRIDLGNSLGIYLWIDFGIDLGNALQNTSMHSQGCALIRELNLSPGDREMFQMTNN